MRAAGMRQRATNIHRRQRESGTAGSKQAREALVGGMLRGNRERTPCNAEVECTRDVACNQMSTLALGRRKAIERACMRSRRQLTWA